MKTPWMYKVGRLLLGPLFKLYYNPKIIGKEYLKQDGPILIVGNHKHLFDQYLTIISTKRFIRYMAKKEYYDNKKTRWFYSSVGCIFVDRSIHDKIAKNEAIDVLKSGGAIGLFPEGTRNKTKEFLLPFKFGAVSIAQKTDAYLIPFGITGEYKFRSKDLTIRYGKPFKVTDMDMMQANELLYNKVKELMEENLGIKNDGK